MTATDLKLRATGLRKVYPRGDVTAVAGVSLQASQGEALGLLGPNGAGKTTLISMLTTLLKPTAGEVELCGFDIGSGGKNVRRVRSLIGLVPQEIALYDKLTGRENIDYFGTLQGLGGAALAKRARFCLDFVGLDAKSSAQVYTYSGGMKRRLNLAISLLHEPRVLFLDEPTVGIDAQSRRHILDQLLQLRREGMTMVYTTHDMGEAQALCSRIVVLDEGKVVTEGEPQALIAGAEGCENLEDLFLSLTGKRLRD